MSTFLELENIPYVSLLKGNLEEDTKNNLIRQLIEKYSILHYDLLLIDYLTSEASREIKEFIATEPLGSVKLVVIDLDKSSTQAQSSLLAILENPPARVKFLLFSNSTILTTMESRSEIFCMPSSDSYDRQSKSAVLSALEAVLILDETRLEEILRNWDDKCHKLLLEWAVESKLRKPKYFTAEELTSLEFPKGFEDSVILSLSVLDSARPRISAKSILMSQIDSKKGS